MSHDYATILLKQYSSASSEAAAARGMRVLDRHILEAFPAENREVVQQLLPGLTRRRLGGRFGVTRKLPEGQAISYPDFLERIRKDLSLTDTAEASSLMDAYMKAHLSLMTTSSRLQFASLCEGDMLRSYLRSVETVVR